MRKLRLKTPAGMVADYFRLFVNRRAYTLQSDRPHAESGRHYYFRPSDKKTGQGLSLTPDTLRGHIEGEITIALYAINPATQRCKWVAIDADYQNALPDLIKLGYYLKQDGVESALEKSNRGGHLWIFMAEPQPARDCRIYVYDLALRLGVPVKGGGLREGIEVFPKHDELKPGEYGNAIRGPLGIHRGAAKRFWFYGADYDIEKQMRYLTGLPKVTGEQLARLIAGKPIPPQLAPAEPKVETEFKGRAGGPEFRILDHIRTKLRKVGRNHVTQCPSCAAEGHDRGGDNLSISIEDPRKYICWAGHDSGGSGPPEARHRRRRKGKPWLTRHSSHQTGNRSNNSWGQRGVETSCGCGVRLELNFTSTSAHAVICCSIQKAGVTSVDPTASSRQMFKLS